MASPSIVFPEKCGVNQAIAVLSPSMAAPAIGPEVHEQAIARLRELTDREVVEFPTTRQFGASAADRARDITAAFCDPNIGAVIATVGGMDEIMVISHLDPAVLAAHPTTFLGYSDNTNLSNLLWCAGVGSFYGGSTQVHLGAGPEVDREHASSLLAAVIEGGRLELTVPPTSEDFGVDWQDPRALTETGVRYPTPLCRWSGPEQEVSGHTWGGCIQVLTQILIAGQFTLDCRLDDAILLLENSEGLIAPEDYRDILRALGERGMLARVAGVMFALTPTSRLDYTADDATRTAYRDALDDLTHSIVNRYNPDAVVCSGVPFGHTRPQWIVPYGGEITLDGVHRRAWARY